MPDIEHRHGAGDAAGKRPQPAYHGAKKGGFAAAVRARHQRDLARRHAVRQRRLDDAHTARQCQTLDGKACRIAGGGLPSRGAAARSLSM